MKSRIVTLLLRLVFPLYAAFSTLMTLSLPLNRYEWMLEDPALRDDKLTFCTLPLDPDNGAASLGLAWIAPVLVAGVVLSMRRRRPHDALWIGLALLALWGVRFFVLAPSCPGRADQ